MRRSFQPSVVPISGSAPNLRAEAGDGSDRTNPVLGRVLDGRYVISRVLGRGGMGVVYLAKQLEPELEVVIKMLSPSLRFDPQSVVRFEGEAKRLQQFEHPNIVRFYGYGYDPEGETNYLAMEYVDGEVLKDVLARKGKLTLEEFVPIASQVLKAVGYVHSHDVFIRDIKPCNVMLCARQGRANFVKLLDFGLAKATVGDQQLTSGIVLGTAGYIAPEVLRGGAPDFRADIYSLGVMFYLCLAGRLPFDGRDQAALIRQTIEETPPHLSTLVEDPAIPSGLVDLIHECLDKDPNRRPADADALMEALIDVVPASLFRLPKAKTAGTSGNDNHGFQHVSDSFVRHQSANDSMRRALQGDSAALGVTLHDSQGQPVLPRRRRIWPWLTVAAVALVAGTLATVTTLGRIPPTTEAAAAVVTTPEAAPARDEGREADVASRFREAERAAARGEDTTALEAYLDVLELEPGHRLAQTGLERVRERIARSEAAAAAAVPPAPPPDETAPAVDEEATAAAVGSTARTRTVTKRRSSRASRGFEPATAPASTPAPAAPPPAAPRADKPDSELMWSPQNGALDDLLPVN